MYLDATQVDRVREEDSGIVLEGTRDGRGLRISARFLIDASGPRGFLHRALGLQPAALQWLPPTQALYTHFEGVERWDRVAPSGEAPPYPVDAAALHHVFDGGWIWILRFNNGITSAGAALTDPVAAALRAEDGAPAWDRLLATLPSVREQFRGARARLPFVHAPRLAFRSREVCGRRWALLPSAAGVIDPLLSTGFPLTLLGITRLLDVLEHTAEGPERDAGLRAYAQVTQDELDATEQLVAALYATMADPALFKRLTLLYFAAASYAETARRLGRPELAPGFLLHAHPRFGPELRACAGLARHTPNGDRQGCAVRPDRSGDRAVRCGRAAGSQPARLVSGARRGSGGERVEAARVGRGRGSAARTLRIRGAQERAGLKACTLRLRLARRSLKTACRLPEVAVEAGLQPAVVYLKVRCSGRGLQTPPCVGARRDARTSSISSAAGPTRNSA